MPLPSLYSSPHPPCPIWCVSHLYPRPVVSYRLPVCVCVNLGKYDVRELVCKFGETWLDPLAWPAPCGGEVDDDQLVTSLCNRAVELRPAHKFGLGTARHKNSSTYNLHDIIAQTWRIQFLRTYFVFNSITWAILYQPLCNRELFIQVIYLNLKVHLVRFH